MSRLGRWSYVCTCGWSTRRRALAALHVTVQCDSRLHHIEGIS